MKLIIPAYIGIANVVADRIERLKHAQDQGSMFYKYGVPLLVVSLLVIAFTDLENDVLGTVETFFSTVKAVMTDGDTFD